ncbi:MAG: protein translocase subunit SecF [bacterium]
MIRQSRRWLIISIITMAVCVVVIGVIRPVMGIDFMGGSLLEVSVNNTRPEEMQSLLEQGLGIKSSVQTSENGRLIIRTENLSEEQHQDVLSLLGEKGVLVEELRFESIGPTIGAELRQKAVIAVAVTLVVLVAYLAYNFRETAGLISAWKFGVAAIYALLHDLLFVMAVFVILGATMGVSIDTLFVTAMLAILGYSVNDTIVIFHRLRSEWMSAGRGSLLDTLDGAVKKSLTRSLNTSFTTLMVLGALLLLGGTSIRWFIVALMAGTIVGTYSSLFVAPPLLYFLAKRK